MSPHWLLTACPSGPPAPQIMYSSEITSVSFPMLASVGGDFYVSHTQHPCFSHLLPAVCALGRLILPPARATGGPPPLADFVQPRPHQPEPSGAHVRRRSRQRASHPPPCFLHLLLPCVRSIRTPAHILVCAPPPAPIRSPQIGFNDVLTSLSVPVLAAVGGFFAVRQTNRLASHLLPAVCARPLGSPPRPRVYVPIRSGGPPQIYDNAALTNLRVPVLASVGGYFKVRHTQPPPASRTCCPAVCARRLCAPPMPSSAPGSPHPTPRLMATPPSPA
eukprot:scaffold4587_cov89-Isochrysis_galbana.AAC.3